MQTEWYKSAFGPEYTSLYAHRDDAEARQFVQALYSHLPIPPDAQVLDIPCGAGRFMAAFQAQGAHVHGMDLSQPLLHEAATRRHLAGHVIRADLRQLPYRPASFHLVVNLFSSLGYFPTDAENIAVIQAIARLPRPGGHFIIDFMNSAHVRATLQPENETHLPNGTHIHHRRVIEGQPPRVNKVTTITPPGGAPSTQLHESVRLFTPAELEAAVTPSGITIQQRWGNYDATPFHPETSPRIILIGQKQ